mmetsp:Transcript_36869/g.115416  ORF Transcript_36869/g.115416 Transcript_36869/m.115416 type:complete len:221 (-) Transcript_36869:173-835(-)
MPSKKDKPGAGKRKRDEQSAPAPPRPDEEEEEEVDDDEGMPKKDETLWVCCDKCEKWRRLPINIVPLPKKWYCHMSPDPLRNTCEAPEEDFNRNKNARNEAKERRLRQYLRSWHTRMEFANKTERTLPFLVVPATGGGSSFSSGASKAKKARAGGKSDGQLEWLRCSSIGCGKWRSLPKNLDTSAFLEGRVAWYCVMNTWDPSLASCNAPEESVARTLPW